MRFRYVALLVLGILLAGCLGGSQSSVAPSGFSTYAGPFEGLSLDGAVAGEPVFTVRNESGSFLFHGDRQVAAAESIQQVSYIDGRWAYITQSGTDAPEYVHYGDWKSQGFDVVLSELTPYEGGLLYRATTANRTLGRLYLNNTPQFPAYEGVVDHTVVEGEVAALALRNETTYVRRGSQVVDQGKDIGVVMTAWNGSLVYQVRNVSLTEVGFVDSIQAYLRKDGRRITPVFHRISRIVSTSDELYYVGEQEEGDVSIIRSYPSGAVVDRLSYLNWIGVRSGELAYAGTPEGKEEPVVHLKNNTYGGRYPTVAPLGAVVTVNGTSVYTAQVGELGNRTTVLVYGDRRIKTEIELVRDLNAIDGRLFFTATADGKNYIFRED